MNNLLQIFEQNKQNKSFDVNDRVLIIDSTNTFIRVISSIAVLNDNGTNVGGITGFLRSIGSNIRDFKASRCIIVFDGKGGSLRRRKLYPEYKANRTGKFKPKQVEGFELNEDGIAESMKWQMQRTVMYLENLPVQIVCLDNIEADDTIAYICKQYFEDHSNKIRIVSTDRDFLQLVNEKIEVYSPVKKVTYTKNKIREELQIHPDNYLLYRTLTGDNSDNIPGITGLGLKTLIKHFPEVLHEKIEYEQLFTICNAKVAEKKPKQIYQTILDNKEQIDINYKLMQLHETDISAHSKMSITDIVDVDIKKLNKINFKKLISEDYISISKDLDNWLYSTFISLNVWAK